MKATGLALIFIATCILAFSGLVAIDANNPAPEQGQRTSLLSNQTLVIPMITAAVMGGAGLLLLLYGGRGYSVNRRPDLQLVESREVTNSVHTIEGR
jgi:hypothetical protein